MEKQSFEEPKFSGGLFDEMKIGEDWAAMEALNKKEAAGLVNLKMDKKGRVDFGGQKDSKKGFLTISLIVIAMLLSGVLITQLIIYEQSNFEKKLWAGKEKELQEQIEAQEGAITPDRIKELAGEDLR